LCGSAIVRQRTEVEPRIGGKTAAATVHCLIVQIGGAVRAEGGSFTVVSIGTVGDDRVFDGEGAVVGDRRTESATRAVVVPIQGAVEERDGVARIVIRPTKADGAARDAPAADVAGHVAAQGTVGHGRRAAVGNRTAMASGATVEDGIPAITCGVVIERT